MACKGSVGVRHQCGVFHPSWRLLSSVGRMGGQTRRLPFLSIPCRNLAQIQIGMCYRPQKAIKRVWVLQPNGTLKERIRGERNIKFADLGAPDRSLYDFLSLVYTSLAVPSLLKQISLSASSALSGSPDCPPVRLSESASGVSSQSGGCPKIDRADPLNKRTSHPRLGGHHVPQLGRRSWR